MAVQQDGRLTDAEAVTIPQAARALGLDVYTVYTFIQRERVQAGLSPSGEFVIPKNEVNRLLKKD
jgi:predicted site-specific integrase-resolvase